MADVSVAKLGPGKLLIGETGTEEEFASLTTKTELNPSVETEDDVHLLNGDVLRGADEESFTLTGTFYQEYTAGTVSLVAWCKANAGKILPFRFVPHDSEAGGDLEVTGNVRVRSVKIGGEVKQRNTTDFEFPGIGDYDLSETTAPA